MQKLSRELPVGSEIQLFQKNPSAIPDIPQIRETSVNKPNISYFFRCKKLIFLSIFNIVFHLGIFFLGLVLINLFSLFVNIVSFCAQAGVGLMIP